MSSIRSLYKQKDSGTYIRPLYCFSPNDTLIVIEFNEKGVAQKMPYDYGEKKFEDDLKKKKVIFIENDKFKTKHSTVDYSYQQISKRDADWEIISNLIKDVPAIFIPKTRYNKIKIIISSGNFKTSKPTIYKLLKRYWVGAETKDTLIPKYNNCGSPGKQKEKSKNKRGRPNHSSKKYGINIEKKEKKIILKYARKFIRVATNSTLRSLHNEMLLKHYSTKTSTGKLKIQWAKAPSETQFRYWVNHFIENSELAKEKSGIKDYQNNIRLLTGSSLDLADGPGQVYQIDETPVDVYIVSEEFKNQFIGRPTLYTLVDVFSRVIVGFHLTIENPSYQAASMAILNGAMNKIEFCKMAGIKITKKEWPIANLPNEIIADQALASKISNVVVDNLGIQLSNTAPGRGDLKGIVERLFRNIDSRLRGLLSEYGSVLNNKNSRVQKDNRKGAKMTLSTLNKIILLSVIEFNKYHLITKYPLSEEMLADNIKPIPLDIWKWGMANGIGYNRTETYEYIKFALLPQKKFPFSRKGIIFHGIYYSSKDEYPKHLLESLLLQGETSVQVSFDPRNIKNIYLAHNNNYYLLSQRVYNPPLSYSLDEWIQIKKGRSNLIKESKEVEIEQIINTNSDIAKILTESNTSDVKVQVKGAREARKKEITADRKTLFKEDSNQNKTTTPPLSSKQKPSKQIMELMNRQLNSK